MGGVFSSSKLSKYYIKDQNTFAVRGCEYIFIVDKQDNFKAAKYKADVTFEPNTDNKYIGANKISIGDYMKSMKSKYEKIYLFNKNQVFIKYEHNEFQILQNGYFKKQSRNYLSYIIEENGKEIQISNLDFENLYYLCDSKFNTKTGGSKSKNGGNKNKKNIKKNKKN
jgi:hypothetical protein